MTRVSRLLASLLLTVCGAALQPAMAQHQTPTPVAAPVNPFLYPGSGIAMGHWDPQQSDVSRLPMPTGNVKPEALDVRFVPGNLINWATAHAPKPGGPEIAWFSGPAMVGTVRLDGGRFELLHRLVVPGYEHLAVKPERMRQLVADLDAAGADEAKLRATFLQGVKEAGLSVATMFNGAYTILDKDGSYFAVYGTGLYKFGHKDPADPLSGIQLVKSLDLKAALPADLADIQIPGIVSRGSGTTPTLIGTGPGEDKLVAIADFGDPVKVVVFWADAIPADFAQKSGTKSRRIADQVSVRVLAGLAVPFGEGRVWLTGAYGPVFVRVQ